MSDGDASATKTKQSKSESTDVPDVSASQTQATPGDSVKDDTIAAPPSELISQPTELTVTPSSVEKAGSDSKSTAAPSSESVAANIHQQTSATQEQSIEDTQESVASSAGPAEAAEPAKASTENAASTNLEQPEKTTPSSGGPSDIKHESGEASESAGQQKVRKQVSEEPPAIEWDWMTGVPIMQYNYILQTMVPVERVINFNVMRSLQLTRAVRETYGESAGIETVLTGNAALLLHIPPFITAPASGEDGQKETSEVMYDDFNVLIVKTDGIVCPSEETSSQTLPVFATTESDRVHPGYLNLRVHDKTVIDKDVIVVKDGKEYISRSAVQENFQKEHDACDFSNILMAFRCSSWPSEAKGWGARERSTGWPPEAIVKEAASTTCYVVGQAHEASPSKDIQWRYQFPEAEQKVAESLNNTQRQCYIFLKIFHLEHLDLPKILTSSHLTAVLFWMCERLPQLEWNPENFATYFIGLLDELLHALIDEQIRDYFMPECNLLENVNEDFLFHLMAKVTDLRKEPLKYLYAFNQKYRFLFSPMFDCWQDIFSPILKDVERPHDSILRCYQAQLQSSDLLMKAFFKQNHFDKVCEVAESRVVLFAAVGHTVSAGAQLSGLALQLPLDGSIEMHEQITARYPDELSALSNLACMYHAKIFHCTEDEDKKKLQGLADATFCESISKGGGGAARMDYAHFLFNMARYESAVEVLKELIEMEKTAPTSGNCYGESELVTMDEQLASEINNKPDKNIEVVAVCYAGYLLVKCYLKLENNQAARDAVHQLEDICELLERHRSLCTSLSLLAYSLYNIQEYDRAENTFGKVAALQPSNTLATENIQLCRAMKISLET